MIVQRKLTIGKLANASNVTVETIRYYQNFGLLVEPRKPIEGYREYPPEYIIRIKFVKKAQELNFSLREIKELLELGSEHCDDVLKMALHKREMIQSKIEDLSRLANAFDQIIVQCQRHDSNEPHCVLIDSLMDFD